MRRPSWTKRFTTSSPQTRSKRSVRNKRSSNMPAPDAALAHHFHDLGQQRRAAELGMWLFLSTEFMFFGGLFLAYLVYRSWYPKEFALGSHTMDLALGTSNTFVLLTSSLTMALAVHAAAGSNRRRLILFLWGTIRRAAMFLGITTYDEQ